MKYIFIPAVALLVCTVISTPTSVGKIEERDPDAVNNLPSRDKKCGDDVFTPANKTKKREFLDYPIIPGDDAWSGQVQQGAYRVYQKNEKGVGPNYRLDVSIKDDQGGQIGFLGSAKAPAGQRVNVDSELPSVLVVTAQQ
ncbi:hypothetical protein MMC22_009324, partial [Lobaria immixta]|nr:hypothetical protein [Lobaria immixta]